jgi:hypothetical protein
MGLAQPILPRRHILERRAERDMGACSVDVPVLVIFAMGSMHQRATVHWGEMWSSANAEAAGTSGMPELLVPDGVPILSVGTCTI